MKSSKRKTTPSATESPARQKRGYWSAAACVALVLLALYEVYRPALSGPFLFDDLYLPFLIPNFVDLKLLDWLRGVRPTLNFFYWLNYQASGLDAYSFHAVNLALHAACGLFVWLVAKKLLGTPWPDKTMNSVLAAFVTAVFLFHPLQTESVAYVASRSELVSGLFLLISWTVFLYKGEAAIGFGRTMMVMVFFLLALTSKEHVVVLPVVLVLSDYHLNSQNPWEAIRKNWRLYVPMGLGAIAGAVLIFRLVLSSSSSAGFGVAGMSSLDYLFTQFRALVKYASMFALPLGQNIDHDFPISHSLLEHGSWFSLVLLLTALSLSIYFRRKYPLAMLGLLLFLVLLAPTSSIVPIQDVFVERRLYLPMLGLALLVVGLAHRLPVSRVQLGAGLSIVCLGLMAATWQRNHVWTSAVALWSDSAQTAPVKYRPRFQLAYALYESGECGRANEQYAIAEKLSKPTYELYADWALAADCASRPAEAERLLTEALRLEQSAHGYALLGMVHGKQGNFERALQSLEKAAKINPRFATTFLYKGNIHLAKGEFPLAEESFEHALEIEPNQAGAAEGLQRARSARRRAESKTASPQAATQK